MPESVSRMSTPILNFPVCLSLAGSTPSSIVFPSRERVSRISFPPLRSNADVRSSMLPRATESRRKNEIARLEPRFLRRTAGALLTRDGAQFHDLNASRRESKPRRHASDIIFRRRSVRLQAAFRHARRAQERRRAHARQAAFPMRSLIKIQPAHKSSEKITPPMRLLCAGRKQIIRFFQDALSER